MYLGSPRRAKYPTQTRIAHARQIIQPISPWNRWLMIVNIRQLLLALAFSQAAQVCRMLPN